MMTSRRFKLCMVLLVRRDLLLVILPWVEDQDLMVEQEEADREVLEVLSLVHPLNHLSLDLNNLHFMDLMKEDLVLTFQVLVDHHHKVLHLFQEVKDLPRLSHHLRHPDVHHQLEDDLLYHQDQMLKMTQSSLIMMVMIILTMILKILQESQGTMNCVSLGLIQSSP